MSPLRVLVIGNFSDLRCGFMGVSHQMMTALRRHAPRIEAVAFDGTYSVVYARQQRPGTPYLGLLPIDVASYDVVHLVWSAMTLGHYAATPWADLAALPGGGPLTSYMDGGPSDAGCAFQPWMQVQWSDYPREGMHDTWYGVPDWVTDLPVPNPEFTVGTSGVREDGVVEIRALCAARGWTLNLSTPGVWLSVEDEVRRLARSTVNVTWYRTSPIWRNHASAPSMMLAARRPLLISHDHLVEHLWDYPEADGVFHGVSEGEPGLTTCLDRLAGWAAASGPEALPVPLRPAGDLSWTRAIDRYLAVWTAALEARRG